MKVLFGILIFFIFVVASYGFEYNNLNIKNDAKLLSRKRRYLQFPAGSSFQLVFCLTYTSIVNSYFVFGNTAALAWELPSMPLFFNGKDFQKKEEETTTEAPTTTELPHEDDHGNNKNIDRISPYYDGVNYIQSSYRKPFYNYMVKPNWFQKYRTPNYFDSQITPQRYKANSYNDFERYRRKDVSHMRLKIDPEFHEVYRRTRRELYNKLEDFLGRINLNGKECLLKAICEVTKHGKQEKETFLVEIFKAIFRVKPHDDKNLDEYDQSANESHDCEKLYPACQGSIRNVNLLIRK